MKHNKHLLLLFSFLFILLFVAIVGVFGASFFVFRSLNKEKIVDSKYSVIGSMDLAHDWIFANSPTYNFDGSDLTFKGYRNLDCNFCYEFTFGFESRYTGYGNRIEDNLVLNSMVHSIVVISETGMIARVITDGQYDEMKGELIQE